MAAAKPAEKSGGKGLSCNDDELCAPAQAAPKFCEDSAVGK